jgi:predicted outer membrane protein
MCRNIVGAVVALALIASQAAAQQPAQPRQPGSQPATRPGVVAGAQPGGASAAAPVDQAIAACLLLGNHEEIALGRFAQEHAKSDEVKQFAKMMEQDHRKAVEKLHQIAPQLAAVGENLEAGREVQPTNAQASPLVGQAAGAEGALFSQMVALNERVAQECLTLTTKELANKEGAEFDRCYIGQQIGAHLGMLAKLKGSEQFASPQLQAFIQEATKTVQKHFDHAKEIAKTLESDAVKSAQRSGDSRR